MKLHRFIGVFDFSRNEIEIVDPELVHQMHTVLKLQKNEEFLLCDGQGTEARAVISSIDKKTVRAVIHSKAVIHREPARHVTAYIAIIKRELFDLVAQKLTEIGVANIVPLITRRTVKRAVKESRLQSVIREAAEQSGRTVLPVLHDPMELADALKHAQSCADRFFFDVSGSNQAVSQGTTSASIFIGPEGGWDPDEVQMARDAGCAIVSLGSLTLRAETAAIVASYMVVRE